MRSEITLLLLFVSIVTCLSPRDGFYVIQHMTHSRQAVDWGLANGANGFEFDLNFDEAIPTILKHGFPCDCDCKLLDMSQTVCSQLPDKCLTIANAAELLTYMGTKSALSIVYVDSKVKSEDTAVQAEAGANVVKLLDNTLFANDTYQGVALINIGSLQYRQYIFSAYNASLSSPNADRYYFTFDWEGTNIDLVLSTLVSVGINNRVFSTGQTSCLLGFPDYESTFLIAESNRQQKAISASIIWTVDLKEKVMEYLSVPVGGIVTNTPKLVSTLAVSAGFTLATPKTVIPSSQNDDIETSCQCQRSNLKGCVVIEQAPKGTACKCAPVTCSASVVKCENENSAFCTSPDLSLDSCKQGGGDCGGY